jgi:hypothetical protein
VRLRAAALVAVALVALSACGDDGPDDYDESIREAFMAGCVEDAADPDLIEVCECTYDASEEQLPFERFRSVERTLQQGSGDVPEDVAGIIVDCIRDVSSRRS